MRVLTAVLLASALVGCSDDVQTAAAAAESDPGSPAPVTKPLEPEPPAATLTHADAARRCKPFGELAATIMEGRQVGVPMSKMMELGDDDETIQGIAGSMVIEAYKRPRMSVDENQRKMTRDFENEMFLSCIEAMLEP